MGLKNQELYTHFKSKRKKNKGKVRKKVISEKSGFFIKNVLSEFFACVIFLSLSKIVLRSESWVGLVPMHQNCTYFVKSADYPRIFSVQSWCIVHTGTIFAEIEFGHTTRLGT